MNRSKTGEELDGALDTWILNKRRELIEDIKTLVRIPSISAAPNGKYPFGEPCGAVVDSMEGLIRKHGLGVKSYDYYGIGALYGKDTAERLSSNSIGFFSHLDVVPPGDGWTGSPFEGREQDGFIIGRGATDNKGPAVAVLYTLKFLQDQGIVLKHGLYAFFGCNEEAGMQDIAHFLEVDNPPAFGLVSDSSFPVCNGEKGILTADFVANLGEGNLVRFEGGTVSNMVPNYASVELRGIGAEEARAVLGSDFTVEALEGSGQPGGALVRISARGISGHAAFPENSVNALQKLAAGILKANLAQGDAVPALTFVADSFADYYGEGLNIAFEDELSGKTTHVGSTGATREGKLIIGINVRYAITSPQEELVERLRQRGAAYGYTLEKIHNRPPCYTPADDPLVIALNDIANRHLGTDLKPFVMGGGTHARRLPRAVGYGPERRDIPSPFGPLEGKAHQVNEAVSVASLEEAIHIYVQAILKLDELLS
ncbi:Xaa-His dipeptidase [Treponema primitia ZAS-2]|uniref:Xaa-His dipeptidase n=1 Tax=Treponema primitia (strain ATCC BAA-887 / DSM 12427 / ZAS-2) TaxID=545694 RepID=F5YNG2_TREPZ|nr:Sapep family Mn(2+)-dependent dipeptidase [Treponema primitia]AEF86802.1 Xaa-His dipeptidase [Treponema primitia ZAS-2]